MRLAITVSVIGEPLLACSERCRRGRNTARRCSAGKVPGLLVYSSSQGEDRAEHKGGGKSDDERRLSTRLFQPEAQDAAGLLAGFEHLAAGRLAEMFEILCRARIGREDFEH